jgi:hypothetical protein
VRYPPRSVSSRAALVCFLLGLVACSAQAGRPPARSVWLPTWGFGAFGGQDLDLRDICPRSAPREVSLGASWATLGVSLATLGVYTPREAKVTCAPPR